MSGYNSNIASKERTLLFHSIERRDALDPVRCVTGHIRAGECVALLGPRRCGKHTLLHALANADVDDGTIAWSDNRVDTAWMRCNSRRVTEGHLDTSLTPRDLLTYYALLYHTPSRHRPIQLVVLPILRDFCLLPTADVALCRQGHDAAWRLRLAVGVISGARILWIDHTGHKGLTESERRHGLMCLFQYRTNERIFVCTLDEPNHSLLNQFDRCIILADGHQIYNGRPRNLHELFKFPSSNPHVGFLYDWLAARDDSDATDGTRQNRRLDLQHASINHNHLGSYEDALSLPMAKVPPYECGCSRFQSRGSALIGITFSRIFKRTFLTQVVCALAAAVLTVALPCALLSPTPNALSPILCGQMFILSYAVHLPPLTHALLWRFDAIYELRSPLLNIVWHLLTELFLLTPGLLLCIALWSENKQTTQKDDILVAVLCALVLRQLVVVSRRMWPPFTYRKLEIAIGYCLLLGIFSYSMFKRTLEPNTESQILVGSLVALVALECPHTWILAWNGESRLRCRVRPCRRTRCKNKNVRTTKFWILSDPERYYKH